MKLLVSKIFLKWQKANKSNKPLMDIVDRFLLSIHNASDIANVTPQPKAAGKNLRKMPGTVDEFSLNRSCRIYSKCIELEPGVISFCLATVGIKDQTKQNDDILTALCMFDDVANEQWTVWQPSTAQLEALASAELSGTITNPSVTDVKPVQQEKKKKGKPLDENGLTVAQRKALRKEQEKKKRNETIALKSKQKAVVPSESTATDSDVARVAEQILAHAPKQVDENNMSPEEKDAQKAIKTVNDALSQTHDLEIFATEILASSSNSDIKGNAQKILDSVQAIKQRYQRTINAASAVARIANITGRQRALLAAKTAANSVQQYISKAKVAYTKIQNMIAENQVPTANVIADVVPEQPITEYVSDDDTMPPADVIQEPADGAPGTPSPDNDIGPDEIRIINGNTAAPSVTLNGVLQDEPMSVIGDVKFDDIIDMQYELAIIEHNMNIERSRIAIEKSKIKLEELAIKKLQLLRSQNMQK